MEIVGLSPTESSPEELSVRRCVACRKDGSRQELLRFVRIPVSPYVAVDIRRVLPGRGASVHPSKSCLARAFKSELAKALSTPIDAKSLRDSILFQLEQRLFGLLLAARRAGFLALGSDAVLGAADQNQLKLCIVATDAAERTRSQMKPDALLACMPWGKKAELGKLFGKDSVALLGVIKDSIANEVLNVLTMMKELAEDA